MTVSKRDGGTEITSKHGSAYVAHRQQRHSNDDVWTTNVAVQTTTTDCDYDYYRLVAVNDQQLQQIDSMSADDDDANDSTLCVAGTVYY